MDKSKSPMQKHRTLFYLDFKSVIASYIASIGIIDTSSGVFTFSVNDFFGTAIVSKPRRYDSFILFCRSDIVLNSPAKPISPIARTFSGIGISFMLEISARAIARSALGSSRCKPPTTFKYMSH